MTKLTFEEWKNSNQVNYDIADEVLKLYTMFNNEYTIDELKDKFLRTVYEKYLEETND